MTVLSAISILYGLYTLEWTLQFYWLNFMYSGVNGATRESTFLADSGAPLAVGIIATIVPYCGIAVSDALMVSLYIALYHLPGLIYLAHPYCNSSYGDAITSGVGRVE